MADSSGGAGISAADESGKRLPERIAAAATEEASVGQDGVGHAMLDVMDRIMDRYGRSGSGRASALRLIGAYVILKREGAAGLRRRGFSRMSIQLYRDKLTDVGVHVP